METTVLRMQRHATQMRPRHKGSKHHYSLSAQATLLTRTLLQLRHVQLLHNQDKPDVLQQLFVQRHTASRDSVTTTARCTHGSTTCTDCANWNKYLARMWGWGAIPECPCHRRGLRACSQEVGKVLPMGYSKTVNNR